MKKIIFLAFLISSVVFSVSAQVTMPAGASDKNMEDRNIKNRSVDLERTKQDAEKMDKPQSSEQVAQLKFTQIKEDFEKIQNLQGGIVEAYTKGKEVDYVKISGNAGEMTKSGTRLKGNLFAAVTEEKKDKKSKDKKKEPEQTAALADEKKETVEELPTDIKTLIVELDNTIMAFTGNPMFTNPKTVSAADNLKAKGDLERIIRLSSALKQESDKTAKPGN